MHLVTETYTDLPAHINSFLRVVGETRRAGGHVRQWRMHPVAVAILQRTVERRGYRASALWPSPLEATYTLFGAPIIADARQPIRRARALLETETSDYVPIA